MPANSTSAREIGFANTDGPVGKDGDRDVVTITFGTGEIPDDDIAALVDANFSFKPGHIIRDLSLAAPIYGVTAAGGHFGRHPEGDTFPWEKLDSTVLKAFKAAL